MNYVNDNDLVYEIMLSQGKGLLTKKAEKMLILIAKNAILKKRSYYQETQDYDDCYQEGVLMLLLNWKKFNHKKYYYALPYFTEIFKRGLAFGYNKSVNKKNSGVTPSFVRLDILDPKSSSF